MGRLTDLLARPSAWIALAGMVLLCAAFAWTMTMRLAPAAAPCPPLQASGPAERMRILDIGAAELDVHGSVCLLIDNVVSGPALGPRQAARRAAQVEVAAAREAVRVADEPQKRIPIWQSRYGVRPLSPEQLAERRAEARARLDAAQRQLVAATAVVAQGDGERRIALFVDGERVPGPARTVRGTAAAQTVTFPLGAAGEASGAGHRVIARGGEGGLVPVTLGIAEEGRTRPAATIRVMPARNGGTSRPIALRMVRPEIRWLAAIGLVLLMAGAAGVARSTGLLRDGRSRYSRYSLARVQMAWWFAVTIGGFVYIWLATGQYLGAVGSAAFALLGISGLTAGASRAVEGAAPRTEPLSRGFLKDIAGGDRIEMHRVQLIGWTIVLGAIVLWNLFARFKLADFDANLLAMTAMVHGLYVVLKTQETA